MQAYKFKDIPTDFLRLLKKDEGDPHRYGDIPLLPTFTAHQYKSLSRGFLPKAVMPLSNDCILMVAILLVLSASRGSPLAWIYHYQTSADLSSFLWSAVSFERTWARKLAVKQFHKLLFRFVGFNG